MPIQGGLRGWRTHVASQLPLRQLGISPHIKVVSFGDIVASSLHRSRVFIWSSLVGFRRRRRQSHIYEVAISIPRRWIILLHCERKISRKSRYRGSLEEGFVGSRFGSLYPVLRTVQGGLQAETMLAEETERMKQDLWISLDEHAREQKSLKFWWS
jgi:hypothetical protein